MAQNCPGWKYFTSSELADLLWKWNSVVSHLSLVVAPQICPPGPKVCYNYSVCNVNFEKVPYTLCMVSKSDVYSVCTTLLSPGDINCGGEIRSIIPCPVPSDKYFWLIDEWATKWVPGQRPATRKSERVSQAHDNSI